MEKTINELGDGKKELKIILSKDELETRYAKSYQTILPNINLKGFRKGKVPLNMVKKIYGKAIEEDSLNEYAIEIFNDHIKDNDAKIIGEPQINNIDKDENGATITYHFFPYPEFELAEYKGLQIFEPIHSVNDEEIQKNISTLLYSKGQFVETNTIENEDCIVNLKFDELDKETQTPIIGKSQESQVYLKSDTVIKELKESLIGKSIGDSITFNPNNYESTSPDIPFFITINNVTKIIPAELNNEFVSNYTKGRLTTVDELREEHGYQLQDEWNEKSRVSMEDQIIDKLCELNEFQVPQHLILSTSISMAQDLHKEAIKEKRIDNEQLFKTAKDIEPLAKKLVKWEFIREKIAQKENIEIEEYDVESIIDKYRDSYGIDSKDAMEKILQNKNITNRLLNRKVLDFLLDFAITTETTFDDMNQDSDDSEHIHDHDHDHEHFDEPTQENNIEKFDNNIKEQTENDDTINIEEKE